MLSGGNLTVSGWGVGFKEAKPKEGQPKAIELDLLRDGALFVTDVTYPATKETYDQRFVRSYGRWIDQMEGDYLHPDTASWQFDEDAVERALARFAATRDL
jgi:hypothetical protein